MGFESMVFRGTNIVESSAICAIGMLEITGMTL